jgi:hypothetical protein
MLWYLINLEFKMADACFHSEILYCIYLQKSIVRMYKPLRACGDFKRTEYERIYI